LDGESFAIGSDEHEFLGLVGLAAPAIADGSGGEEVVAGSDLIGAFDLAFESSEECVLDSGEVGSVAVPSLGLLWCPFKLWIGAKRYGVGWDGAIDGSAFEHDGAAPHPAGDGY
jgi:hypothetical protein